MRGMKPDLEIVTRVLFDLRLNMRIHCFILFKIGSLQSAQHSL